MHGGAEGNERLTARTAIVLLVLLALEGATLVAIGRFLVPHVFLGFLLIPPVALKIGSTAWRMFRYYRRAGEYVRRGPPHVLLRMVIAPVVVLSTVALFATGVAVVLTRTHGLLLTLHKASFIAWVGAMTVHVLWHVWKLPGLALDRLPGHRYRLAVIGLALVVGLALAVETVPLADAWQDQALRFA